MNMTDSSAPDLPLDIEEEIEANTFEVQSEVEMLPLESASCANAIAAFY